jgi:hypothetical protein
VLFFPGLLFFLVPAQASLLHAVLDWDFIALHTRYKTRHHDEEFIWEILGWVSGYRFAPGNGWAWDIQSGVGLAGQEAHCSVIATFLAVLLSGKRTNGLYLGNGIMSAAINSSTARRRLGTMLCSVLQQVYLSTYLPTVSYSLQVSLSALS